MNAVTVPSHFVPLNSAFSLLTFFFSPLSHFHGPAGFVCQPLALSPVTVRTPLLHEIITSAVSSSADALSAMHARAATTNEPITLDSRIIIPPGELEGVGRGQTLATRDLGLTFPLWKASSVFLLNEHKAR